MKTKDFLSAIDALEQNGIAREITISALKEAFESTIKKKNYEDSVIKVDIIPEEGKIDIFNVLKIVDEVEDDALEIARDDAEAKVKEIKGAHIDEDDYLYIPCDIEDFTRADAMKLQSIFKQKIKEAEKANIYAAFADKVGEIVAGYVEKVDARYTLINLGRTSVILPDKHKIGDETFEQGALVKVYLAEVNSSTQGPQIMVSRADPGFLKRLFEEEIHDVFDGTVVIKDIAREAGERSKVSVISTDPNVDPVGACIGQGGNKIQKICSQINHEKVDVVQHHLNDGLFIAESLKPATVLGVKILDGDEKRAIAVVKDGDLRVAIGKKGVNARLAVRLTGYNIDIMENSEAIEKGINYDTLDHLKDLEEQAKFEMRRAAILEEQARDEELRKKRALEEIRHTDEKIADDVLEDLVDEEILQEPEEEKVVEEEVIEYKPKVVGEKISLFDLEKQIEEEKKRNASAPKPSYRKNKKEEVIEEEKPIIEKKVDPSKYLEIYTEEELQELEQEDDPIDNEDDDIDYEEFDVYYDEN